MPAGTSGTRLLRAHLREALRETDPDLMDALGALATWEALLALWESGWLGARRPTASGLRMSLRRRVRELAASARPCAAVVELAPGTRVLVDGHVVAAPDPTAARALFVVEDHSGARVAVDRAGARWVPGPEPAPAAAGPPATPTRVSVLGFADREVAPEAAPLPGREPPWRGRVRAGPTLPLIVASHPGAAGLETGRRGG